MFCSLETGGNCIQQAGLPLCRILSRKLRRNVVAPKASWQACGAAATKTQMQMLSTSRSKSGLLDNEYWSSRPTFAVARTFGGMKCWSNAAKGTCRQKITIGCMGMQRDIVSWALHCNSGTSIAKRQQRHVPIGVARTLAGHVKENSVAAKVFSARQQRRPPQTTTSSLRNSKSPYSSVHTTKRFSITAFIVRASLLCAKAGSLCGVRHETPRPPST